ncbi:hypothetical protein CgunFtcFv8_007235 [Champsocephalus gunnari]|uniref:Uncharacterized protein n=1 Tax=Champsocephalus gunnari TaxID=52237 RepID=A0AAN8CGZ8_CHAGU|nr:hypothetical protein CgunFtcFv8_007235 [Champsocephalus gunnari]
MPLPSARNRGNTGTERVPPVPPRARLPPPAGSFRLRPAARQVHPPHTLRPSGLLTRTGAPRRLGVGGRGGMFAPQIHPEVGFFCVGYISISRGTVRIEAPSFHSCATSLPPLTGMEALIPSHWLVCMKRGCLETPRKPPNPPTPKMSFHFQGCSHCPPVNVVNRTRSFSSEAEERGNNARLNKHFDN